MRIADVLAGVKEVNPTEKVCPVCFQAITIASGFLCTNLCQVNMYANVSFLLIVIQAVRDLQTYVEQRLGSPKEGAPSALTECLSSPEHSAASALTEPQQKGAIRHPVFVDTAAPPSAFTQGSGVFDPWSGLSSMGPHDQFFEFKAPSRTAYEIHVAANPPQPGA